MHTLIKCLMAIILLTTIPLAHPMMGNNTPNQNRISAIKILADQLMNFDVMQNLIHDTPLAGYVPDAIVCSSKYTRKDCYILSGSAYLDGLSFGQNDPNRKYKLMETYPNFAADTLKRLDNPYQVTITEIITYLTLERTAQKIGGQN